MEQYVQELSSFHPESIDALFETHSSCTLMDEIRSCEVPILCCYEACFMNSVLITVGFQANSCFS